MLDDLRHSVRRLRRSPTLTAAAVCTLAIAIGASTAVFSVVDKVLVRPLPIDEPDRVVVIWPREPANPTSIGEVSHTVFRSWQSESRSFSSLAAIGSVNWSLILDEGEPATLQVAGVSASFFPTLGTPAALGRTLLPEDDRPGAEPVAVLSHVTWARRFGADPNVVGRRVRFREAVHTIVGVMPEGFDYPRGAELWMPVVSELAKASAEWNIDALGNPAWGVLSVLREWRPQPRSRRIRDSSSGTSCRIRRPTSNPRHPGTSRRWGFAS